MIEKVLPYHRCPGTVEVDGCDIGRIVRDEKVSVDAWKDPQEHGAGDAQLICQGQHRHDDGALRVDQNRNEEEYECYTPGIGFNHASKHRFHFLKIVAEVCVRKPGNAVDCNNGDHTALPYGPGNGFLGLGLAEHYVCRRGHKHDDLDIDIHLREVDRLGHRPSVSDVEHLAERKAHNDHKRAQEDEHRCLRGGGYLLVKGCRRVSVHILVHFRVRLPLLELRVLVQVLTPLVGGRRGTHKAADAGRYRNHQDLGNRNHIAVGIGDCHEGDDCRCDGRAGNSDLGCDGRDTAGALRTDILFEGYVTDDGHNGVDHVAGSDKDRKEEGHKGPKEGDMLRMPSEKLLRNLYHPVHASGGLQRTGAGHRSDNNVDYICRGSSGLKAESEYQNCEADSGNCAKRKASISRSYIQGRQHNQQLNDHRHSHNIRVL